MIGASKLQPFSTPPPNLRPPTLLLLSSYPGTYHITVYRRNQIDATHKRKMSLKGKDVKKELNMCLLHQQMIKIC